MDWTRALPTETGTGADPQLMGELGIDPLAVLDELIVAVLEAGAGDEGGTLAREDLRPVGRGHPGDPVRVDDVVARVAARAEHEGVGHVDGGGISSVALTVVVVSAA